MDDNPDKLKLFCQLYESSRHLTNEGLEKLKKRMTNYDINPNLNYRIMKKMLNNNNLENKNITEFYDFYRKYIQTLFYEQKMDIITEIKKKKNSRIKYEITKKFYLNEMSFIDSYFDIIEQ